MRRTGFRLAVFSAAVLLSASAFAGTVTFKQDAAGVYQAFDALGNVLPLAQGVCGTLDTAVAYAATNSQQFTAVGGGSSAGSGEPTINCSGTWYWPPVEKGRFDLGALTINFPESVGAAPGLVFDSCLNTDIKMSGQLTYFGTSTAIVVDPFHLLPIDTVAGVTFANCNIAINTGFGAGSQTSVVDVYIDRGAVIGNFFKFNELHASGRWHLFRILWGGGSFGKGFIGNHVTIGDGHGNIGVAVFTDAGSSQGATNLVHDNVWDLTLHPWAGGSGFFTAGQNEEVHLSILGDEAVINGGGLPLVGIGLDAGASGIHVFQRGNQAQFPVNPASMIGSAGNKIF